MVRAYFPQRTILNVITNTNNPPQGNLVAGGIIPANGMLYEDLIPMAYEIDWFNILWQERIPTSVIAGQVPSTQNDFPLLINSTFPELIGQTIAQLRFAGVDDVQLEYEIERFDPGSGELIAWVNKPTISDGEITYVYFDNPAAIDEQNPSAVWDVDYTAVWHMNNVPGGLGSIIDSTSNSNNGLPFNLSVETGKIGLGYEFNGMDSYIEIPSFSIDNNITVSVWVNYPTIDQNGFFIGKNTVNTQWELFIQTTPGQGITWRGSRNPPSNTTITTAPSANNWHYLVATQASGAPGTTQIYIDGSLAITSDDDPIGNNGGTIDIGRFAVGFFYEGLQDEVRVSNSIRSADRITTEFNNQNSPSTFYSIGAQESIPNLEIMGYET